VWFGRCVLMCQRNVLPSAAYAFTMNYVTEYSIPHTRRPENLKYPLMVASVFGYYYFRRCYINRRKRLFFISWWPSIYLQVSGLLPLDEFSCNLVLGTLIKICWENTYFFKIGQKYRQFIWGTKYLCNYIFILRE